MMKVMVGVRLHVHHWDTVRVALCLRSIHICDDGEGWLRAPLLSLG